jgi:glycosyltransferase involved in cell wall biosynthesis
MRIVVDATAAVSGGKVYLDHLLPALTQAGSGHEFIVFHLADIEPASIRSPGRVRWHRVRLPRLAGGHRLGGGLLKLLWRLLVLPSHLRRLEPDLLFSNAGFAPPHRPARTKLILALHNSMPLQKELFDTESSPFKRMRLVLLRSLLRQTLRHCDGLIVFSEDLKRRIRLQIDGMKREPSVIYHGIEWGERERGLPVDARRLEELGIPSPYLLYVSHFHPYKNVIRLIEAFAILHARHPEVCLVLAGEAPDRGYWDQVQTTVTRLGLRSSVRHVGQRSREELRHIYRAALALVYPSLAENCPFAILEALALGLPIAAARTSSLPEICGDAAVFFDPGETAEMAEVMGELVSRPGLREDLCRRSLARAQAFSWPKTARQTLLVFEQVAAAEPVYPGRDAVLSR